MTTDPHTGFVVAAYLVALVVIAGMIAATLADYTGLKKRLERLAARTGRGLDAGRK
ncbi:MAG: heme exporter protein CcmD [Methylovirgula sp.]